MKKRFCFVLSVVLLLIVQLGTVHAEQQHDCLFSKSLHKTGEGMRYWYEADDGFKTLTGIPYDKLGCKQCHVKSCDQCHLEKTDQGSGYSLEAAKKTDTCLKCHSRAKAVFKMDKDRDSLDVHINAGMVCADCHTSREIHGDGKYYNSMRSPDAKDTACTNCHTAGSEEYPELPDTKSHTVHKGKLDCSACHVQNTMTCYNCHFGEFTKTKNKPQSYFGKVKEFLLLVKYRGKVTSGNMQTLVSADNEPFIIYAPYLTHSIMGEGRKCEQCHNTKAVNRLDSGNSLTMATFKDGKLDFYKGVVPVVPDLLNWPFLDKKDGQWAPFKPMQKPLVQMGLYAEPITKDELKKLSKEQKYEN